MTTTGAGPQPTGARRGGWIDRRPVETGTGAVFLVVGTLMLVLGAVQVVVEGVGARPVDALFSLVLGLVFGLVAGLSVSRPGPDRMHVLVYRTSWVLAPVGVIVATYAVLFR